MFWYIIVLQFTRSLVDCGLCLRNTWKRVFKNVFCTNGKLQVAGTGKETAYEHWCQKECFSNYNDKRGKDALFVRYAYMLMPASISCEAHIKHLSWKKANNFYCVLYIHCTTCTSVLISSLSRFCVQSLQLYWHAVNADLDNLLLIFFKLGFHGCEPSCLVGPRREPWEVGCLQWLLFAMEKNRHSRFQLKHSTLDQIVY